MKHQEIETKYYANDVSLTAFNEFCKSKNPTKFQRAAGPDFFFTNPSEPDTFCRHRVGPNFNQLTFKRKTKDTNNYVRVEHNIDVLPAVTEEQVEALCSEFGYKKNGSIFKVCNIYYFDKYSLVYYLCYDKNMKETGRFIEIELDENHPWESEEVAWSALTLIEQECKGLGLTAQGRIKRSLYELFIK